MIDIKAEKRRYGREALKAKLSGDKERAEFYYGLFLGAGKVSMWLTNTEKQQKNFHKHIADARALFEKYGEKYYHHITLDI